MHTTLRIPKIAKSKMHYTCRRVLSRIQGCNFFLLIFFVMMLVLTTIFPAKMQVQNKKLPVLPKDSFVIHSLSPFCFARVGWSKMEIRVDENTDGLDLFNLDISFIGSNICTLFYDFLCGTYGIKNLEFNLEAKTHFYLTVIISNVAICILSVIFL